MTSKRSTANLAGSGEPQETPTRTGPTKRTQTSPTGMTPDEKTTRPNQEKSRSSEGKKVIKNTNAPDNSSRNTGSASTAAGPRPGTSHDRHDAGVGRGSSRGRGFHDGGRDNRQPGRWNAYGRGTAAGPRHHVDQDGFVHRTSKRERQERRNKNKSGGRPIPADLKNLVSPANQGRTAHRYNVNCLCFNCHVSSNLYNMPGHETRMDPPSTATRENNTSE